jgi:hypothetical protein
MSDTNYVTDSSKEDSSVSTFYRQDDSSLTDSGPDGSSMDTDASDAYVCEGKDEPNYISADHCYYPDISRWKYQWQPDAESDDEKREPLVPSKDQWPYGYSPMCSKEEIAEYERNLYDTRVELYGYGTRSEDHSDDSDESVVDAKPVKTDTPLAHEEWEEPSYRPPWKVAEHQRCLAVLKLLEEHPLADLYDSDDSVDDVKPLKTEK